MSIQKCPLCGRNDSNRAEVLADAPDEYTCKACGRFFVSENFLRRKGNFAAVLYALSAVSREAMEHDLAPPTITEDTVADLIAGRLPVNIADQARRLLRIIASRSSYLGAVTQFAKDTDYTLAFAQNPEEFRYLFAYLRDEGWIRYAEAQSPLTAVMTPKGWEELQQAHSADPSNPKVFVAMSFDETMIDTWEQAISPAIEETGYKAVRIDKKAHNNLIDNEIIAEIRESRFVVADFTGQRAGVYFEAGFARGLGLQVVHSCRSDDTNNLHFDANHYNYIKWSTLKELREQLTLRIRATIGKGPLRNDELSEEAGL